MLPLGCFGAATTIGATGGGVALGFIGGGAPSSGGGSGGVFCCGRTGGVSCCCKGGVFCCAKRSAPAKSSSAQTKRRFIPKVREDETAWLKCKLRMVEHGHPCLSWTTGILPCSMINSDKLEACRPSQAGSLTSDTALKFRRDRAVKQAPFRLRKIPAQSCAPSANDGDNRR